ncbi:hypothetical protein D030_1290B, partial [Vibrio parahaemolyticus AQ3810]
DIKIPCLKYYNLDYLKHGRHRVCKGKVTYRPITVWIERLERRVVAMIT